MPTTVALDVYRGDDHTWTLPIADEDLTGATLKAEIRALSGGPVLATLGTAITLPNVVTVTLPAADSTRLPAGRLKWDLQAVAADTTRRTVIAGPVTVTADVTDSDDPVVNPLT
jgi:hypothetical protein